MGTINNHINELINNQLNTYKDRHRIKQDKNNENDFKKSYRYREVLELIQNCIDEFDEKNSNNDILIKLKDNTFEISNTGNPFLIEGIRSLMIANVSPKKEKEFYKDTGYIGNKGLGFRSVLNWANDIKIFSQNELSIQFNQENSNQYYKTQGLVGDFAVFSYPKEIELTDQIRKKIDNYTTLISLSLQEDKVEDVRNQLDSIDYNTLLFLPKINTLKIIINDDWKTYTKITEKKDDFGYEDVIIQFNDSFGSEKTEEYRVYETIEQSHGGETINIKVSYHPDIDTDNNPLYSYFKLGINLPIKWKINANFELSEEREKVKKTDLNRKILERLIEFLFECAEKEANLIIPSDFAILTSLIPKSLIFNEDNLSIVVPKSYQGVDNSFYFTNYYKNKILQYKLLPLLNGEYTSYVSRPISFNTDLIEKLNFEDDLRVKIISKSIPSLISTFIPSSLIEHVDFELINQHLKDNVEDYKNRVELAVLFFSEFKDKLEYSRYLTNKDLPNFFQSATKKTIENGNIFYTTQQVELKIPSFVSIDFIDSKDVEFIKDYFQYTSGTRFYQTPFGKIFGFHEYVFKPILAATNSALNKHKDVYSAMEEYIVFVNSSERIDRENNEHVFYLLDRNNNLRKSRELYLGFEYDNKYLDDLYVSQNNLFVRDFSNLNLNKDELKSLFIDIGVSPQPRIIQELLPLNGGNYNHVYLKYIPEEYEGTVVHNPFITSISYNNIDNFQSILDNSENTFIIKWLLSIINKIDENDTSIFFKWGSRQNPRVISGLPSFLFYQIENYKWYKLGDKKYSLNQIILYKNLGDKYDDLLGISEEDLFLGSLSEHKDLRDKFKRIFRIKNDFSDLPDHELYALLNCIELIDKSGQISKKIYLDIETNKKDTHFPKQSHEQDIFFHYGKIFCYDNEFHSINADNPSEKVFYANKYVLKSIEKKRNLMSYSRRKNATIIKNWFNVDVLDQDVKVKNFIINTSINLDFQKEIEDIKKYILAIRINEITTDSTEKVARNRNNFRIYPCYEIDNEEELSFEEFEFCKSGNDFYIKISNNYTSIDDIRKNSRYCSSVAEIIQTAHDLKDDFRDKIMKLIPFDEINRKEQLEVEYNDETLLSQVETKSISDIQKIIEVLIELGIQLSEDEKNELANIIVEDYKIQQIGHIEIIKGFLIQHGKTTSDFNNNGNIILDFTRNNNKLFIDCCLLNEQKYYSYLFINGELNEGNLSNQQSLYYENYCSYNADNRDELNIESEYMDYFQINKKIWEATNVVDFKGMMNFNIHNYDSSKIELIKQKYTKEQIELYAQFGKLDDLYKHIIHQNNKPIKPDKYSEVDFLSLYEKILNSEEAKIDKNDYQKADINEGQPGKPGKPRNPRTIEPDAEANKVTGFIAEVEAYRYLKITYKDADKIEWISGNAEKAKNVIKGDDTVGYDIRIRLKNGKYKYFEVKGSTDTLYKIEITTNEINHGLKYPKDYSIIFVKVDIDNSKADFIKVLDSIFDFDEGETLTSNKKFSVRSKSHILYFDKKKM